METMVVVEYMMIKSKAYQNIYFAHSRYRLGYRLTSLHPIIFMTILIV